MSEIQQLQDIIDACHKIVFFTGAGVSTESGIPDFRSVDGIYNTKYKYPPETIISHSFYKQHPEEFYRFYRDRMIYEEAKPNQAHLKMAELEQKGKALGVITQNIDGLHQQAGSKKVCELHGSIHRNYCEKCHKFYSLTDIMPMDNVPRCSCGGMIKPDVVLYEEGLDQQVVNDSISMITQADCLVVTGTSLIVYPAAGLIDYFLGDYLVVINKADTPKDHSASLLIQKPVGQVLSQIEVK